MKAFAVCGLNWLAIASFVLLFCAAGQAMANDDLKRDRIQPVEGSHAQDDGPPAPPERAPDIDLSGMTIEDRTPVRSARENVSEHNAYCRVLTTAKYTTAAQLAKSARRDLTLAHLMEQPGVYRGQVVHVDGYLKRVRRFEAPTFTWSQDVRFLYEGWLQDVEKFGDGAWCIVFTDLPPGLEPAEEMDRRVSFDGYFFKRYRYKVVSGWEEAPLLIGHAPVLRESSPPMRAWSGSPSGWFIAGAFTVAGLTVGLIVGLTWWYRRADRRVRSRLLEAHPVEFVAPEPEDRSADRPGVGNG